MNRCALKYTTENLQFGLESIVKVVLYSEMGLQCVFHYYKNFIVFFLLSFSLLIFSAFPLCILFCVYYYFSRGVDHPIQLFSLFMDSNFVP